MCVCVQFNTLFKPSSSLTVKEVIAYLHEIRTDSIKRIDLSVRGTLEQAIDGGLSLKFQNLNSK